MGRATHLAFRLACILDKSGVGEQLLGRILTRLTNTGSASGRQALLGKQSNASAAMLISRSTLFRGYCREARLNAIWESNSNMIVFDVQRVLAREPKAIEPLLDEARVGVNAESRQATAAAGIEYTVKTPEIGGGRLLARIALGVRASLPVQYCPPTVANVI